MRKTALLAGSVALVALLGLSSCDAMFDSNVFKTIGLGQIDVSKADLSSPSAINEAAASSPDFYAKLSGSQKATALSTLIPNYSSSMTSADLLKVTTAANLVLAATLEIKTTQASEVIDKVGAALGKVSSSGSGSPDMGSIVASVLPANALVVDPAHPTVPPQAFRDIITSFTSASTMLQAVADDMPKDGSGTLPAVPGGTSQDTATYAVLSIAIAAVKVDPAYAAKNPTATPADALWVAINNTDPKAATPIAVTPGVFDFSTGSKSTLNTLLGAADINIAGLGGSSSSTTSTSTTTTTIRR